MTPPPARASGSIGFPSARASASAPPTVDAVRQRVYARLLERFDPAKLRRTPDSILRPDVRRAAEQLVDGEAPRITRSERDKLVDELVGDVLGYGPLDELFRDPGVREVMVLGPAHVVARRDQGWGPTVAKFRDADHLRAVLEKAVAQADGAGNERLPPSAADGRLPNGFRVVAVVPPPVVEHPPLVTFVRADGPPAAGQSGTVSMSTLTRSVPAATLSPRASASAATAAPRPFSSASTAAVATPAPRAVPPELAPPDDRLGRLRARITERIVSKLASMGVYDLRRIADRDLQKAVAAYIDEFGAAEKVPLTDDEQAKLTTAIMAAVKP